MKRKFLKHLYNRLYALEEGIKANKKRIELYKDSHDIVRVDDCIDQKMFIKDTIKYYIKTHK